MRSATVLITAGGGELGQERPQALWSRDAKPARTLTQGKFEIVDVLNKKQLSEFIRKNEVTQIYHLAAVLSATGEKNPAFAWHLNMDGLIHVLDAAVEFRIEKIYWPSSIAVFGPNTPKNHTRSEERRVG